MDIDTTKPEKKVEVVRLEGFITRRIKSKGIAYVRIAGRESCQAIRIREDELLKKKLFRWR